MAEAKRPLDFRYSVPPGDVAAISKFFTDGGHVFKHQTVGGICSHISNVYAQAHHGGIRLPDWWLQKYGARDPFAGGASFLRPKL